jgi:TetR/AcrR family transcriptional regulator
MTLSNVRLISSPGNVIAVTQPRRSPRGPDRKRDPERTRERLLEAALLEFAEHGYAGARISAIAKRAGVNQQLVSYYFDGKEGLFKALQGRWRDTAAQAGAPDRPLAEVAAEFLRLNAENRPWARMLVWGALADGGAAPDSGAAPDDEPFFLGMVDDLRRRQEAGEIAADLDPGHLMLLVFGAVLAPTVVPQIARQFTGLDPDSGEFREAYAAQLKLVIARLAGPVQ